MILTPTFVLGCSRVSGHQFHLTTAVATVCPTLKAMAQTKLWPTITRVMARILILPAMQPLKKDLAARLAHKKPYERIHTEPSKQLDLLIVVDRMLTGVDSKWLNTLYLDKVIKYQNII